MAMSVSITIAVHDGDDRVVGWEHAETVLPPRPLIDGEHTDGHDSHLIDLVRAAADRVITDGHSAITQQLEILRELLERST